MKKIILFFTAVVIMGTTAFAAHITCAERQAQGLPTLNMKHCDFLMFTNKPSKCCWKNPRCENVPPGSMQTCESFIEQGQTHLIYSCTNNGNDQCCCWESKPSTGAKGGAKSGGNDKGNKKTPVQSPKAKKGNALQPVKAKSEKAQAQNNTVAKK